MHRIYGTWVLPKVAIAIAMLTAMAMLVATFRAVLRKDADPRTLWKIFVFWTIAPPFWFALEYFWLFKEYSAPEAFDAFKYGQENAQKFWAAILALLGARLFKDVQLEQSKETSQRDSHNPGDSSPASAEE